jgi:hypothetical protein
VLWHAWVSKKATFFISSLTKLQFFIFCKWAFGDSEELSEEATKWNLKVFYLIFFYLKKNTSHESFQKLKKLFAEEYVRQMKEGRTKFLLVDGETFPRLEPAVKALGRPVTIIAFGDLKETGVIPVSKLLSDDGSGG